MTSRFLAALAVLAAAGPVAAADAGEGGGGHMLITPQPGTIIWTLVTFSLLMLLLRAVAWKPLLGALDAREKQIKGDLDQARSDREEAHKSLEENRTILAQARRERAEAVEAGRRDAERLKEEILEQARKQGEARIGEAKAQIEAEMRQARAELRRTTADLAIQAASRLIAKSLDDASQRQLVEDFLADLDRLPPGSASLTN